MFGTRKLGRTSDQRKAMLRQLTTDLLCEGSPAGRGEDDHPW